MNSGVAGGNNSCNHFKKGRNGQTLKGTWRLEILRSCKKQIPSGMIGTCVDSWKHIVMRLTMPFPPSPFACSLDSDIYYIYIYICIYIYIYI